MLTKLFLCLSAVLQVNLKGRNVRDDLRLKLADEVQTCRHEKLFKYRMMSTYRQVLLCSPLFPLWTMSKAPDRCEPL